MTTKTYGLRGSLCRVLFSTLTLAIAACSGQAPRDVCETNSVGAASNSGCATGGQQSSTGAGSGLGGNSLGATGGTVNSGGSAVTGGESGSGGSSTSATASSSAGSSAAGGSVSTGGTLGTSGSSATGGTRISLSQPTGGTGAQSSSGGTSTTTGGSSGIAGASTTGGTTGTCGAPLSGVDGSDPLNPKYFWVDESCYPTPTARAGFIDLEPVNYTYMNPSSGRTTASTTAARIFYSFIPALTNAKNRPVIVIFNGGPGGSTSGCLLAFGTGPMTLHADATTQDSVPKANPNNWANLGNLLYIDARQTGFSYGVTADPTNQSQRAAGYTQDNFNFFADAADFVRAILRILKTQPAIQNNPVVLLGESYGGMRASVLLQMVLDPVAVGDSQQTYFVDSALSQELQNHFATVFKNEGTVPLSRARIARQFGSQVLIQPGIDFSDQYLIQLDTQCDPNYLSSQRLMAMGLNCPLTTDAQMAAAGILTNAWLFDTSTPAIMTPASLAQMLGGIDPTTISGLSSSTRPGAYRLPVDDSRYIYAPGSWTSTQGTVPTYDRYYVELNYLANDSFRVTSPLTRVIGMDFLQNLLDVHTFITRAALDFVIIPEVIPKSFMALDAVSPVLSDVSIVESTPTGTPRPGEMVFTYRDVPSFGVTAGTQRNVRFPTYLQSGHSVTAYQPTEFYADVSEFLTSALPPMP